MRRRDGPVSSGAVAERSSEGWRKRAVACSVATAIALGLREALEGPVTPAPIVVDHDGEPGGGERVTLFLHPDIPEASLVLVR